MRHFRFALIGASLSVLLACSSASHETAPASTRQADTIPSNWPTPTVNLPGMNIPEWSAAELVGNGGKCLAASGTANGSLVGLAACDGSAAQMWRMAVGWPPFAYGPNSITHEFVIHGPGGRCLTVANGANADGTPLQLWDCYPGAEDEEWGFNGPEVVGLGNKCLDGGSSGAGAQIWDCNSGPSQVWTRNPNGPPSLSGKVYLSDLAWSSALSTMWTPNGLATTADAATLDHAYSAFANDQPISINGQSFAKGVSFLADGDVTYTLGGQCSQFVATVGGDDTSCGPMSFALFRDESAVLANGDIGCRAANQQIQVDLQGANTIRLDVAADPQYMGMAIDWADAYLVCGAQSGGWSPLGGTATSPLVVGANADGRLQVFERGSDGALWSNWQSGASWSGWNSFGGTLVADGTLTFSAMSNGDGKLEFFSQGTDQALWQDSQLLPNGTWGGFYSLGGSALRPVAGRNAAGLLDVFALGADAAIWHLPQKPLGIWSSWESLAGQWPPSSRVAVGNNADGRLQIFVRGTDGALWSNWQQTDGNWYGWYSFGTSPYTGSSAVGIASDPTAIQDAEGFLEVFARGTDGAVWHISQVALNGGWSTWSSLGGIATGGVAAANNQDGTLEVFVRGTDGALWHDKEATPFGSWTGWMPLGGIITGDPVAARGADGRIDVFATASDGATVWQDLQTSPGSFAGP